eukprot:3339466-Pyramimonas_sp.AAC.1
MSPAPSSADARQSSRDTGGRPAEGLSLRPRHVAAPGRHRYVRKCGRPRLEWAKHLHPHVV